ncbi:MAG: IcmT/TraK family protein [Magnetococcus sp. WYHC-3]
MASEQIDNLQEKLNWHWRNSMRIVRFFNFDARAAAPIPLLMLYFRPVTLAITIMTLIAFRFLEHKGLTVPSAMRTFRAWLVGIERPGIVTALHRGYKDFG